MGMSRSRDDDYLMEAADRVMLKELTARYMFCMDYADGDQPMVDSLFVENGRYVIPLLGIEARGRAAIRALAKMALTVERHLHHVQSNHVFDISGASARGRCQFNEFVTAPDGIIGYSQGWYEDDYVWQDGRWWFEVRRTHLTPQVAELMTSPAMVARGFTLLDKMTLQNSGKIDAGASAS
jgi:hypothetical protein